MAQLLTLGAAVDLTDVAIQQIFLKKTNLEKRTYYDKYFNVETGVTDRLLKDSSLSGMGNATRITENAVIQSEAPVQGYDKTYTQVEFGKLMPVTKQMWKFGIKKRKLEAVAQALKDACLRYREIYCADKLDQAYQTSYTKTDDSGSYTVNTAGGDGVAAASSAHTREDGGTNWSNIVSDGTTVNMDFDYDAIKAAHRTASLILDPKGQKMDVHLDTFVFTRGTSPSFRAQEILKAIKAGGAKSIPGSADNDGAISNYNGETVAYNIIDVPYVTTNTNYWMGFDSSMMSSEYGFQYKESQPIELEGPNVVFKTGEIQYKATMMFDIGHNDARDRVFSKNTNQA